MIEVTIPEITPEEDAADLAVWATIELLARHHKPEDFMFSLGIAFAQGLGAISKEARDEALEEFFWRLRKYTGIEAGINEDEEEDNEAA